MMGGVAAYFGSSSQSNVSRPVKKAGRVEQAAGVARNLGSAANSSFESRFAFASRAEGQRHGVTFGHNQTQTDNLLSDDDDNKLSVWVTKFVQENTKSNVSSTEAQSVVSATLCLCP